MLKAQSGTITGSSSGSTLCTGTLEYFTPNGLKTLRQLPKTRRLPAPKTLPIRFPAKATLVQQRKSLPAKSRESVSVSCFPVSPDSRPVAYAEYQMRRVCRNRYILFGKIAVVYHLYTDSHIFSCRQTAFWTSWERFQPNLLLCNV